MSEMNGRQAVELAALSHVGLAIFGRTRRNFKNIELPR
jgi:hypothetical protein